jgi:choline dehydrogenase-like flavoprotein
MSAKGWDYVVIGAGAAGCVVAGRLSQMLPEARIALIEAGRERLGVTTRVPGIAFIAKYLSAAELELPDRAGAGAERA